MWRYLTQQTWRDQVCRAWKLHSYWWAFLVLEGSVHTEEGRKESIVLHILWTFLPTIMTKLSRCSHWCCDCHSSNQPLSDWFKNLLHKIELVPGSVNWTKKNSEWLGLRGEPNTIILLNEHSDKLTLQFYLYTHIYVYIFQTLIDNFHFTLYVGSHREPHLVKEKSRRRRGW